MIYPTKNSLKLIAPAVIASAMTSHAQVTLYSEDFNSGYTNNTSLDGQNGWSNFSTGAGDTNDVRVRSRADIHGGSASDFAVQIYGETDYGGRIGSLRDFGSTINLNDYQSMRLQVDVLSIKEYNNPSNVVGQGGINPEMLFLNYHIGNSDVVQNQYFGPGINFNDPDGKYSNIPDDAQLINAVRAGSYQGTVPFSGNIPINTWVTMFYDVNIQDKTYQIGFSHTGGSFTSAVTALPAAMDFDTFLDQSFMHISGDAEGDGDGTFYKEAWDNISITAVPTPEPSSTFLLGAGSLALILRRRK